MNQFFKVFIFLLLTFSFSHSSRADNPSAKKNLTDTIRIIGSNYSPPYDMLDANGKPVGFCVDLINEVMKKMHRHYTLQLLPRSEIMKAVRAGKADLVLEMTYSDERAKVLHFGTTYNYSSRGALFRTNGTPINSFEQFKGKTIAAERQSYSESILKKLKLKIKILPVKNHAEGAELVKEGKCDAMLCNLDIAQYITRQNPDLSFSWIGFPPDKFCLASTDKVLLDQADYIIYQLKQEGVYGKILNKWVPKDKSESYLQVIYICIISIAAIVLIFAIIYFLLHYKIVSTKKQLINNQKSLDLSLHAGDVIIWGYDVRRKVFYNVSCTYYPPQGSPYEKEKLLFHPEDLPAFDKSLKSTMAGNPPKEPQIFRMDRSGKGNWQYIEKEFYAVRDENGNIEKVIGTHKNVTEKINNKRRIDELVSDHEVIFNNSTNGCVYYDSNGFLFNINDTACKIFGIHDKQTVLGKKVNIFDHPYFKGIVRRDNIKNDYFIAEFDFDDASKRYFANKESHLHGLHYIGTSISPIFNDNGSIKYIITQCTDLTERETLRKKVEDYAFRMKYILKASGSITWTYDPYTHIYKANDEKNNKSTELPIDAILKKVCGDDKIAMDDIIKKMDQCELNTFNIRAKFDKSLFRAYPSYFNIDGMPVRDQKGKILYYLGLSSDITELIDIQHKLQEEKEEAQKADKLKSAFLANVSHEIRTPLNSIVGFSDLLQYTDDEKEKKDFINIIKVNNQRLLNLIDDVLDLSKIESGTMKIIIEAVDVESVFNETFEVFTQQLSDSPVDVIYHKPYNACIIDTDRVRFTQVLTNFMTNAVKYTEEGHIRLGYEHVDGGIRIFVEDTGRGIPHDRKEHVFERFEKLDSLVQGTGLGLSICKDIAMMFHGKIGVESDLGKGSTFWMWIPAECKITQ